MAAKAVNDWGWPVTANLQPLYPMSSQYITAAMLG